MMNEKINFKEFMKKVDTKLSEKTIAIYEGDVGGFFKANKKKTIRNGCSTFERTDVENYIRKMKSDNLSAVTINRKLSSLRKYNEYMNYTYDTDYNLIYGSDYVSIQSKGNPTKVNNTEIESFVSFVLNTDSSMKERNVAMIMLMCNTGLRREEICNLLINNIAKRKNGWVLKINGKGNKLREVVIPDIVEESITKWIDKRNKSKYADSPHLFISQRGGQLRPESINSIFDYYSSISGVKVHPHALRHNYGSTMMEEGILSLVELKNQMGHSNVETTMIYTHARQDVIMRKAKALSIGMGK